MASPAALIAALALAACSGAARPRQPVAQLPGTLWSTPARTWHLTRAPSGIHPGDSNRAIATSYGGYLVELDLATGAVVREVRALTEGVIDDLVRLPGERWLVVGSKDHRTLAVELDKAWRPRPIALPHQPNEDYFAARAVVVADGVVIAGRGLPLNLYDPATWKVKKTLDATTDFREVHASRGALFAWSLSQFEQRFDLATGARTEADGMVLAAANDVQVARLHEAKPIRNVARRAGAADVVLPELGFRTAIDPKGRWIATSHDRSLDGRPLRR